MSRYTDALPQGHSRGRPVGLQKIPKSASRPSSLRWPCDGSIIPSGFLRLCSSPDHSGPASEHFARRTSNETCRRPQARVAFGRFGPLASLLGHRQGYKFSVPRFGSGFGFRPTVAKCGDGFRDVPRQQAAASRGQNHERERRSRKVMGSCRTGRPATRQQVEQHERGAAASPTTRPCS